jgi:hypothetical protein
VWLDAKQTRRIGEHRPRVRLGEALPIEDVEKDPRVLASEVGVIGAIGGHIAEVAVAVDHLLRRSAADAELQSPARDEIGGASIFSHVERVFVAHVNDAGPDLDPAGPRSDGCEQRERRGQLIGEMVHPEVRPVRTQLLCGDCKVNGLQQHVRGRASLRVRRRRPMAERQEPNAFHDRPNAARVAPLPVQSEPRRVAANDCI